MLTVFGALAPGEAHDVRWELTPIAGGTFAVYVVALPESAGRVAGPVASSDAIPVDVTEVRTLNAGGALPVSILIPLILVTRKAELMGTLVNRPHTTVVASIIATIISVLNVYLIYSTIFG